MLKVCHLYCRRSRDVECEVAAQQAMAVCAIWSTQPTFLKKSDFPTFFRIWWRFLESRAKKSDFLKSDFFPYMVDLKAASDAGMQLLHFCILHPHMCDAGPRQLHPCIPASPCAHINP